MRALLFAAVLLLWTGCATTGAEAREATSSRPLDMAPPDTSGLQDADHDALPLKMRDDPRDRDSGLKPTDLE